jgi:hypothetical protein
MKKGLFFLAILIFVVKAQAQNVGIGTTLPLLKLHIKGGLLLDSTNGTTPVSGAGTRLMWIPNKAAFRAGSVTGPQWDDVNIGSYSFAGGNNTIASGSNSTSMGEGNLASGPNSTAMGYSTTASGTYSTAMGVHTNATGIYSTALGIYTNASGWGSIATGNASNAIGTYSTAMGYSTSASGELSTSMGEYTKSKSRGGFVAGIFNDSSNAADPANFNSLNRLFQIGNGTADNARSNAMTVLQNGNVGIGITTPSYMLTVKNDINVDNGDANAGTTTNALKFGGNGTGESIGSNRTTATNQWGLDFYTNSINRMAISLGGNIGMGTTAPTAKLSVNGTANNATGTWGVFSDSRIKTITDDFTDGLNVIRQIQPVNFIYNDNAPFKSDEEQIGIVAQDLEKIAPYMVSKQAYKEFTDLREVNNQAYVFLLINAVKEQQVQIETQQKENAVQKKLYNEQQQRINNLETTIKELTRKVNQ